MDRARLERDTNFSLTSHAHRAHRVCKAPDLFTDFEKKLNCFAVYIGEDVM